MNQYHWPGNVRELENYVRRFVVLGDPARAHEELVTRLRVPGPGHVRSDRFGGEAAPASGPDAFDTEKPSDAEPLDLKTIARRAAREAERKALLEVLERVRWNRAEAARILKVSYKTMLSKLNGCGIGGRRPPPKES
jgi:two-component system response regulator AtoC